MRRCRPAKIWTPLRPLVSSNEAQNASRGASLAFSLLTASDRKLLIALTKAIAAEKANVELIAPKVSGVTADDGSFIAVNHMIDGGFRSCSTRLSFDVPSSHRRSRQQEDRRRLVADAFQHCKYRLSPVRHGRF